MKLPNSSPIALRRRMLVEGRTPITRSEWRESQHKSTKSMVSHPAVLAMDENGATALFPIVIIDLAGIHENAGRQHAATLEFVDGRCPTCGRPAPPPVNRVECECGCAKMVDELWPFCPESCEDIAAAQKEVLS